MHKIGRMTFPSKEHFDRLLKTGLIKDYDTSPQLREQHDEEMKRRRKNKPYIKGVK